MVTLRERQRDRETERQRDRERQRQDLVNARVTGVKYVSMYLKQKHLPAQ